VSTANEFYDGPLGPGSYGLGQRVPMIVVSPWSTGGWVCSETFDHTSIIRLIEERFGVTEPNITPWRRAVCGDLTAAFDFSLEHTAVPRLPDTAAYQPHDHNRHPSYVPTPPVAGTLPRQEPGTRPARPIGYDLDVVERSRAATVAATLVNKGDLGAHFQARFLSPAAPPRSYTVGAQDRLAVEWPAIGPYDIALHGPNGFFRRFAGDRSSDGIEVTLRARRHHLVVSVHASRTPLTLDLTDAYTGRTRSVTLGTSGQREIEIEVRSTGGWYDVRLAVQGGAFVREFSGHLESGRPSISDPALGRP
jgi:phospholipase C